MNFEDTFREEVRQKALEKAQFMVRAATCNPLAIANRERIIYCGAFYDGSGQWNPEEKRDAHLLKRELVTFNLCQGFIDNLSGVEIQSRFRVACRSDSDDEEEDKLAEALTHLLFFIQEDQDIPYKGSLKFRDSLIGGIGWSHLYYENNKVMYEYVDPLSIYPDYDDITPQLTEMRYVCRKYFLTPEYIKRKWKNATKDLDLATQYQAIAESPEIADRRSRGGNPDSGLNTGGSKLPVWEVQYKEQAKCFCGTDIRTGRYFETFNIDLAEELCDGNYTKRDCQKIMRAVYIGDTLLEFAPLKYGVPDQADFSYIPLVFKRETIDRLVYGVLENIMGVQRECNARLIKANHAINSIQVIIEDGGNAPGSTPQDLQNQIKRLDSIIVVPQGSKWEVINNNGVGEANIRMFEQYLPIMQRITGVHDEMLGIQTNATSAVSQHTRQVNSVRNNVFAFDSFSKMKKREAKLMLDLIQESGEKNRAVLILNDDEREVFVLNEETFEKKIDKNGEYKEILLKNDIRWLPISLYVDEVPDFQSKYEERNEFINRMMNNPNAPLFFASQTLMKWAGARGSEGKKIAEEMQRAIQQKAVNEQGGGQAPPQGQAAEGIDMQQILAGQMQVPGGPA